MTRWTPSTEDKIPEVSEPKEVAGRLPAIISSFKYTLEQMSLFRGIQSLLKMNPKGGFDCPSCAWPDPDERRSKTEFCENGSRAVADEATNRRIKSEFFKNHSISELGSQTDLWLGQQGRLSEPVSRPRGVKGR